ncbi:hypothetical protein chiPu_0016666 [Chiloscyllium punctatum]|uniref:Uncharacterized protein n=1 Tax=Chiloscyllium punctatum TaxID=137246 RepID=A0A401T6D6_CHIPU|nr:hypothetical protein [Chiloscyllium punctatum]
MHHEGGSCFVLSERERERERERHPPPKAWTGQHLYPSSAQDRIETDRDITQEINQPQSLLGQNQLAGAGGQQCKHLEPALGCGFSVIQSQLGVVQPDGFIRRVEEFLNSQFRFATFEARHMTDKAPCNNSDRRRRSLILTPTRVGKDQKCLEAWPCCILELNWASVNSP